MSVPGAEAVNSAQSVEDLASGVVAEAPTGCGRKSGRKLFTSSGSFAGASSVGSTPNCLCAKVLSDSRAVCGPTKTASRRCSRSMTAPSPMAPLYQARRAADIRRT